MKTLEEKIDMMDYTFKTWFLEVMSSGLRGCLLHRCG